MLLIEVHSEKNAHCNMTLIWYMQLIGYPYRFFSFLLMLLQLARKKVGKFHSEFGKFQKVGIHVMQRMN